MPLATSTQVGGDHYADMAIQPFDYIHANDIPFAEGSVIKYVSRWRNKNGVEDLRKARHFIDMLIEAETAVTSMRSTASVRPHASEPSSVNCPTGVPENGEWMPKTGDIYWDAVGTPCTWPWVGCPKDLQSLKKGYVCRTREIARLVAQRRREAETAVQS